VPNTKYQIPAADKRKGAGFPAPSPFQQPHRVVQQAATARFAISRTRCAR
jgi:hypothetical protein